MCNIKYTLSYVDRMSRVKSEALSRRGPSIYFSEIYFTDFEILKKPHKIGY